MMMPMALLLLFSYTLVLATVVVASVPSHSSSSFAGLHRIQHHRHSTTLNIQQLRYHHNTYIHKILQVRGGGDDDEYDSDEYDSDEEEPIVTKTKRLSSSTKQKVQRAKSAQVKSKVKVAMMSSSSSSAKSSALAGKQNNRSLYKRFVPYIIRACINPFTLLAMTKSYFVSLCDINYLKEVSCCSLFVCMWLELGEELVSG